MQATAHLIEHGTKTLCFRRRNTAKLAKDTAATRTLSTHKLEQHVVSIDITSGSAYQTLNHLLREKGCIYFDAIVACSDMVALGAMKAKALCVSIPNDVALVGFDDIAMADINHPSLSTIKANTQLAASLMVKKLMQQFLGEKVESQVIDIELYFRQSSKR
ncbi:substrate-binding domain-containing protein (plasmid) [Pseudoalteromonas espejiana]